MNRVLFWRVGIYAVKSHIIACNVAFKFTTFVCRVSTNNVTFNKRYLSVHITPSQNRLVLVKHKEQSPRTYLCSTCGTNTSHVTTDNCVSYYIDTLMRHRLLQFHVGEWYILHRQYNTTISHNI